MEIYMENTKPLSGNPLLAHSVRIPGETFQIPSGGLFYEDGEISEDVVNGEVHVYPMTAYDEILIKTPDMLFSGKAIEQIFARCIPQIKKPLRLLARDVDFLLICLRSVSFGSNVTVIHTHNCENAKEHKYNVSIDNFIQRVRRLDPAKVMSEYVCDMSDGKRVFISPMRYDAVIDMMTAIDPAKDLTPEELHDMSTKQLASLISKVEIPGSDDVRNQEYITEWLKSLPLPEIRKISNTIDRLTEWGADTEFTEKCKDCGEDIKIVTPLNPMNFFT